MFNVIGGKVKLKGPDWRIKVFCSILFYYNRTEYLLITIDYLSSRISAHDLLIERGRYFRPRIPRESRTCTTCDTIENEEHFMLHCSKNSAIRNDLFQKMKIEYPGLIPNTDASLKTLVRLMNPATVEETKYICDFITASLNLR